MKKYLITALAIIIIGLGIFFVIHGKANKTNVLSDEVNKETTATETTSLDIELLRANVTTCNEEIKPELEAFHKEYTGGGNAGIAVPEQIFYNCLNTKMVVTDEILTYIAGHSDSATPPFILQ